jgi:hypothetical protein
MAVAEISPERERFAPPRHKVWRGRAFGIALESAEPFQGLPFCDDDAGGRIATWQEERARVIDDAWTLADGEVVVDLRHTDGRVFMRIDRRAGAGYRIWAPYYGRHVVSADGRTIHSALPNVNPLRWQRLFFAQALPLAAALQGLEVFHASAVAVGGRVVAFVGPSGTGKTSVAAHIVTLGASFVTDEVLAVERDGDAVVAHPGPARLGIDDSELRRIPDGQKSQLGLVIGRSDKLIIDAAPITGPLPLGAVYFLRPVARGSRLSIFDMGATATSELLRFRFSLDELERLANRSDVCGTIAERTPFYEVLIPHGARAREVATTALAHIDGVAQRL